MISVVVPTYKEEENLEELFRRIDSSLEGREYEIVLVDDNSPDETAEKARELSDKYPVNLFVRQEDFGLSQSVIRGFKEAKGDQMVVMDADLQHPPEKIPDLLAELEEKDMAIGSRFKESGSVEGWSLKRKLLNRGSAIPAKIVMWPMKLSDPMSGFFAFNRDSVDVEDLDAEGFKILLEVLYRNKLDFSEVQFEFQERKEGESDLGLEAVIEYMEHVGVILFDRLGIKQSKRLVKAAEFMGVGGTGVLVNYAIFLSANYYGFHYLIAGAFAFLGALQWNFIWNRKVTFSKSTRSFRHQYFYFFLVNLGGFFLYELFLLILVGGMDLWKPLANIIAIFGGFTWNFFGSEKIAFQ